MVRPDDMWVFEEKVVSERGKEGRHRREWQGTIVEYVTYKINLLFFQCQLEVSFLISCKQKSQ